jgi:hypothetical protein
MWNRANSAHFWQQGVVMACGLRTQHFSELHPEDINDSMITLST